MSNFGNVRGKKKILFQNFYNPQLIYYLVVKIGNLSKKFRQNKTRNVNGVMQNFFIICLSYYLCLLKK